MDVKEVGWLIGVIIHAIHSGTEGKDAIMIQSLLITVNVSSSASLGDVFLTPGAELFHGSSTRVHIVVLKKRHFIRGQKLMCFVVMIEKVGFAVGAALSDAVQPNITGHVRRIEMADQLIGEFGRKLCPSQTGNVLDPSRARFRKSIHFKEPSIRLIDENDEEEGKESTQHTDVRFLE